MITHRIKLRELITNLQKPLTIGSGSSGMLPIPTEFGKQVGLMIVGDLKGRISRGVSPDNSRYLPLGHPRPAGGDKPLLSTGVLRNSITSVATKDTISVGTNLLYGPVHQYGATIYPVKAKLLAIPVTKAARYAGSPRRFPGRLRFVPTKSGGVLKDESNITHYILVEKVDIPARPFIGISDEVRKWIDQAAARMFGLQAATDATNGGK